MLTSLLSCRPSLHLSAAFAASRTRASIPFQLPRHGMKACTMACWDRKHLVDHMHLLEEPKLNRRAINACSILEDLLRDDLHDSRAENLDQQHFEAFA